MRLNRLEEAGHWYRESLRAKPDHIPAHLTYAKLLSITVSPPQDLQTRRYSATKAPPPPLGPSAGRRLLLQVSRVRLWVSVKHLETTSSCARRHLQKLRTSKRDNSCAPSRVWFRFPGWVVGFWSL